MNQTTDNNETVTSVEENTKPKKKFFRFLDFFSGIFKRHTKEEKEKIFVCGTKDTTPAPNEIDTKNVHPWIYSRIFMMFLIATTLLGLSVFLFNNTNALPGFIILGSFMVPVACLFLFFEINVPRNISFAKVLKYLLVGGCVSLFITIGLFQFVPMDGIDFGTAWLIALVEEFGKMVIVAIVIFKLKTKYCLNGLLIGACIGAGFAAFESAGYAFNSALSDGLTSMVTTMVLRAILAPGGHVVWAAISGYGIEASMGKKGFSAATFLSWKFWLCFLTSVVLHAVWDMPFDFFFLKFIGLVILSWVMVLILTRSSLKQVDKLVQEELTPVTQPEPETKAE